MSENEPAAAAATEADDPPLPNVAPKSRVIPILVGVNTLMMLAVLGVLVMRGSGGGGAHGEAGAEEHGGGESKSEHKASAGPGPVVRLGDFVVRLRDPEVDRYARMSFDVELDSEVDKTAFTARVPQVRDFFISYLSDRSLEDLRGREALEKTKAALTESVKKMMPDLKVRGIYISEFVVQ